MVRKIVALHFAFLLTCQPIVQAAPADDAPAPSPELAFDGERAFALLEGQCDLGPRVPGTRAHARGAEYLTRAFRELGVEPIIQRFTARPSLLNGRVVTMKNIVGRVGPDDKPSVLVSAHWDSRPVADRDPDPAAARQPITGANDGASGAAVVLELARIFADKPLDYGMVFVLHDGEDLGTQSTPKEWCLGARYLVERLEPSWDVRLAINIDMVGDKDLGFTLEQYADMASDFAGFCWAVGEETAPEAFQTGDERRIFDDHAVYLMADIPAFNLIDFDYEHWHTQNDTARMCSAQSLETAGRVIEAILRRLETSSWKFPIKDMHRDLRYY